MKRTLKYITIPITLWENSDLSFTEKAALIEIDNVTSDPQGVRMTPKTLATMLNITSKEAKDVLNSLYRHQAITLKTDEDGQTRTIALLYKDNYSLSDDKKNIDDKKSVKQNYDYDYIQEQWNTINPNLPQMSRFTPKRKKQLRICLSENGVSVETLIKAFKIVSVSDFLNGRSAKNQSWRVTLDWIIKKAENLDKILSGTYCNSYQEKLDYQAIMSGGETEKETAIDEIYK
jgi:hypothetical protein